GTVIHWYKQKEGEAPQRLLYFVGGKASFESSFQGNRYMVENVSGQTRCVLTIKDIIPDDTATYYCAYWDPHSILFGLFFFFPPIIIADKGISAPANFEILQKKHADHITYVCLVEKFYPEVIQVTWTDKENKEVTDKVVKGHAWKNPTEEDKYSIGSWLTVPANNKEEFYHCKYEHESPGRSLSTQDLTDSQEEDCSISTVFNRGNQNVLTYLLVHRAAYLVYIVLLLKSSMYYLTILFFIYR
ncbi:IGK protein, partial [Alcedo cyanopectus]|nr:IGK protein [Ceyx cyanopectus]